VRKEATITKQSMMNGLQMLVAETAQLLEAALDHDGHWCAPTAGSEAATDLANAQSGPAGAWNEAPVRDLMDIAWMALGLAGENARAAAVLLGKPALFSRLPGFRSFRRSDRFVSRTSYPVEVLSRSVIEAAPWHSG
jgi:hypothetical protein